MNLEQSLLPDMAEFQVNFVSPLSEVLSPRADLVAVPANQKMLEELQVKQQQHTAELRNLLNSLTSQLSQTQKQVARQEQDIQQLAVEFAIVIVRKLFQDNSELVEQRILQQLKLVLAQFTADDSSFATVYAPAETISWLQDQVVVKENTLKLVPEAAMPPGDFRVEWKQLGLSARLEDQLERVGLNLKEQSLELPAKESA